MTLLSGFVCNYHPADPGSNLKHNIYAFSIIFESWFGEVKNKQKKAGNGPFLVEEIRQFKIKLLLVLA